MRSFLRESAEISWTLRRAMTVSSNGIDEGHDAARWIGFWAEAPTMRPCEIPVRRSVLTTGIVSLALASPLVAFEVNWRWAVPHLSFAINPNFPDLGLSGSREEQIEILLCAARAWETQTRAGLQVRYGGETDIGRLERDGVNAVFWSGTDGDGALAGTKIDFDPATNDILHFDIIFYSRTNGVPIDWSGPGEPPAGTFDIGGIATHEFGHALGLGHSTIPSATMFAAATARGLGLRTLDPDDREGVEFLYGSIGPSPPGVEITRVDPDSGASSGGDEVLIHGVNFTYDSDTQLRIDGMTVSLSRWRVESCDVIRVTDMPPHVSGAVDIAVSNTIGTFVLPGGFVYAGGEEVPFTRGDANADGEVDIADATATLGFLFEAEADVRCPKALDSNDDGSINISDPAYLLNFLFASGELIPPPYPDPGVDPTPDELPCGESER